MIIVKSIRQHTLRLVLFILLGAAAELHAESIAPAPRCGKFAYPVETNGVVVCKRVPECSQNSEALSYDSQTQQFRCVGVPRCGPRQRSMFINGATHCLEVPKCDSDNMTYGFDGSQLVCVPINTDAE